VEEKIYIVLNRHIICEMENNMTTASGGQEEPEEIHETWRELVDSIEEERRSNSLSVSTICQRLYGLADENLRVKAFNVLTGYHVTSWHAALNRRRLLEVWYDKCVFLLKRSRN